MRAALDVDLVCLVVKFRASPLRGYFSFPCVPVFRGSKIRLGAVFLGLWNAPQTAKKFGHVQKRPRRARGEVRFAGARPEARPMKRLDIALVERGLCESRERAKRAIMAGQVQVNQQLARKPSDAVRDEDDISLVTGEKYVSRGGAKLEAALRTFDLDVSGQTALDVGASTGGFTDCLLQQGVAKVYAVDVGHGQLAWKLRHDARE